MNDSMPPYAGGGMGIHGGAMMPILMSRSFERSRQPMAGARDARRDAGGRPTIRGALACDVDGDAGARERKFAQVDVAEACRQRRREPHLARRHRRVEAEERAQQRERRRCGPGLRRARRRVRDRLGVLARGRIRRTAPAAGRRSASAASNSPTTMRCGLLDEAVAHEARGDDARCRAARPSRCGSSRGCRPPCPTRACARPSR